MREDRLTYLKCRHCHGTGKVIIAHVSVERCFECDGTGNALVDGKAAAHRRRIAEIESGKP